MSRTLHRLTIRKAAALCSPGLHADGGGLYLRVALGGSKSWVFVYLWQGARREMGLGGLSRVDLHRARTKAFAARMNITDGIDPLAERRAIAAVPTFGKVADDFIEARRETVRSDKSVARWRRALGEGGYSHRLRAKRVDSITTEDVLDVLRPIWMTKAATAQGLRGYLETVLDAAKSKGLRRGDNPARWDGHLEHLIAKPTTPKKHHAAMPYAEVPAFLRELAQRGGTAARGLEFLILNANRSGEVRLARWGEFGLDEAIWTIPPQRTKTGKEHRIPLSARSVEILKELGPGKADDLVFRGARTGQALSLMAFEMLLRRMKVAVTTHGFRSSFRDWAGDMTHHPREIAEAALGHVIGSDAERAYRRGDALQRRRVLMQDWAAYCAGDSSKLALRLHRAS